MGNQLERQRSWCSTHFSHKCHHSYFHSSMLPMHQQYCKIWGLYHRPKSCNQLRYHKPWSLRRFSISYLPNHWGMVHQRGEVSRISWLPSSFVQKFWILKLQFGSSEQKSVCRCIGHTCLHDWHVPWIFDETYWDQAEVKASLLSSDYSRRSKQRALVLWH